MGYLRALWHYWHQTHCTGLKDDSEFLRGVCEIDSTEWDAAFNVIFDGAQFFIIGDDEKWHQKRASMLYQEAVKRYDAKVAAGRKGGYHMHKKNPK